MLVSLFFLPFLIVLAAVIWILIRVYAYQDDKNAGSVLGLLASLPIVLFAVRNGLLAHFWTGEGFGWLLLAFSVQVVFALIGEGLRRRRDRKRKSKIRGRRDPAYYYIDE